MTTTTIDTSKLNETTLQEKQPKQIGDFIIGTFCNKKGKTLGEGTFGKVRLATHKHTQQKVAIKFLQKKKISEVADVQRVTRQIHILKLIRHPNLVQLYQIIQTPKQLLLIMQFMQNGELFDYIVKSKRIKEQEAKRMFHQIIDGVEYIHKIGVAHRDLKPENILLGYNRTLKVVDFGLGNTYKKGEVLKTPCGSPCYAAPQMIQGERYDGLKVDIWSSGIILFAMLNGYLPFEDEDTNLLYKKVLSGTYEFHHSVSEQAKDLIKKILTNTPASRFTIEQIRNHPWMQKYSGKKTRQGIIVGYNKIPVDSQILSTLQKYNSNYDLDYVQTCIEANRHNEVTVTYYLAMKKFLRSGGVSKYDLGNDNFDNALIQPTKRKQNVTTQTLIDNFFTKTSYGGSTDITQQHNEKKENKQRKTRLSRQKQQGSNKQNCGLLMNMNKKKSKEHNNITNNVTKKSKQKHQQRQKQRSRDNIKLRQHPLSTINTSHMIESITNNKRSKLLNQSVQKRSQTQIKKIISSSTNTTTSKGKIQQKRPRTSNNLNDTSINYGRVPLTRSIQKTSGRESELYNRQSMMENRVTRKYKEQFNQSLVSKSKGKLKTQRERQRVNSTSINQSISHNTHSTYQGFNTTVVNVNTTTSQHALMNLSKKYKEHNNDSSGYIEEYLMRGKKGKVNDGQKKTTIMMNNSSISGVKLGTDSGKVVKARRL